MAKEAKYYTTRKHSYKGTTYLIDVREDKRLKDSKMKNHEVRINGKFPRPGGRKETPGVSYLNQVELDALRTEPSFTCFEQSGEIKVTEIPFKDLPEEKQKEYDLAAYNRLKSEAKAS